MGNVCTVLTTALCSEPITQNVNQSTKDRPALYYVVHTETQI